MEWTEELDDKFRAQRRAEDTALVNRVMADARKRYDAAESNYQCTGSSSTMRTVNKYADMIRVCELALRALSQECGRCSLRYKNGKAIAQQLRERAEIGVASLPVDEVIGLIEDVSSY